METNEKTNCLHGGKTTNFDRKIWNAEIKSERLVLRHVSPDEAGDFPREMKVWVSFTLTDENELVIEYKATTDKATPF